MKDLSTGAKIGLGLVASVVFGCVAYSGLQIPYRPVGVIVASLGILLAVASGLFTIWQLKHFVLGNF